MNLVFIFPISGPNNGVKVISNHIQNFIEKNELFKVRTIDTAQASDFSDFGRFNLSKLRYFRRILMEVLKNNREDIVYLNLTPKGLAFYRDLLILLICRIKKNKVSIHLHANDLELRLNFFSKQIISNSNIIVINRHQLDILKNHFRRVYLLPNALPDFFKYDLDINTPKTKEVYRFIFLSNISKEKGSIKLEEFARVVDQMNSNIELNIYGGILDEVEGERINKITIKYPFVKYHGHLTEEAVKYEALKKSNTLLFLSDINYEVYPLVYIEALMSNTNIMTTQQHVANNLEKDRVAYILNEDFSNLEQTLDKLIFENELSENPREVYLKKFSFNNYIESLIKILTNG